MSFLNKFGFWKKFSKYLIVGISVMTILAFFQTAPLPLFAQSTLYACPTETPQNLNPMPGSIFNAGTRQVTLSWNSVPNNSSGQYYLTVRSPNRTPFEGIVNGTSQVINQNLVDGETYTWYVRAYDNTQSGGGSCPISGQATFTITGSGGGGQYSCTITPNLISNSPSTYTFTGNLSPIPSFAVDYRWDFNEDTNTDAHGQTSPSRSFGSNATVYLDIYDTFSNLLASCSTTVTGSGSVGTGYPVCVISPSNQPITPPNYAYFSASQSYSPSGRQLSYAWDLDGNNGLNYNDDFDASASKYYQSGNFTDTIYLRVTDTGNSSLYSTCQATVNVGTGSGNTCNPQYHICPDGTQIPNNPNNFCQPSYACPNQGSQCSTDQYRCPDGSYVSRNPNNSCQFYSCSNTGSNNCQPLYCPQPQPGCVYIGQNTNTCSSIPATCGTLSCNQQPQQPYIPPMNLPTTFPFGDIQQTLVNVANANANANENFNFSDSFSEAFSTGGYSYAGAGAGGSSTVNIR